jgi:hypothetical protein
MILVHFSTVSIDCANGDNLLVNSEDRTSVLYNYCKPLPNQSVFLLVEARYIFISLSTGSSRTLSASFKYYIIETTTSMVQTAVSEVPITTTSSTIISGAITFVTLSTASTAGQITSLVETTASRFPTLSTAGIATTTVKSQVITTTQTTGKFIFFFLIEI